MHSINTHSIDRPNVSFRQDTFTDLNSLQRIKQLGRQDQDQALKKIAQQFESMFMQMMLKNMRAANAVFEEGNELNSFALKMHRDMLDNQLALDLAKGHRSPGLADHLYRQLKRQYSSDEPSSQTQAVSPRGENTGLKETRLSGGGLEKGGDLEKARESRVVNGTAYSTHLDVINKLKHFSAYNRQVEKGKGLPPAGIQSQSQLQPQSQKTGGNKQPVMTTPEAFVANIRPYAEAAASQLGVDSRLLMAQAALETGWGKHILHDREGNSGFNLFNIKADQRWPGERIKVSTLEYRDGLAVRELADFRRYSDFEESFNDYVTFISTNPRYQGALAESADARAYINQLQQAGYATDPEYAEKIIRIYEHNTVIQ